MAKRLPAEWEPQSATLLTWPHALGDWGSDYHSVEQVFIAITKAIATQQTVVISTYDNAHEKDILKKLQAQHVNMSAVVCFLAPSNDVWARDHGPITVLDGNRAIQCDFTFNAWGGKYPANLDDKIPERLFQSRVLTGYDYQKIDFILEGGSIESDGKGTLLTTSQCLHNQQRNSGLSQFEIESKLTTFLGVDRYLWLDHGYLLGDDTDGHIDTLARFFNEETIGYVSCEDENDIHYQPLKAMYQTLKGFKTRSGKPYRLVSLPLPSAIYDKDHHRLPATYANFLITNTQVLVPIYQDKHDAEVLTLFNQHFPQREIIGIDCRAVIEQFGSLHCLTMQIPLIPSVR